MGATVPTLRWAGMIGALAPSDDPRRAAERAFRLAVDGFDPAASVAVLGHFDADGMAAVAILVRALGADGRRAVPMLVGKGETPWDAEVRARLRAIAPGGLVVTDLGTHPQSVLPGCPTVVIDHHLPTGLPEAATTISGNGLDPEPTSALLAWWATGGRPELLWLAALGLIGDMAEDKGFAELAEAQGRWGKTALRDATTLVNAPRRTAVADASPALRLLLTSDGPKAITKGDGDDARALVAAKAEVRVAVEAARRVAPKVVGDVAMIAFHSGCQIHPLIAQQWRGRLKDKIVLAANTGYRPGWVHFAARSATGRNLVDFLAQHRPEGADGRYGNGHAQATGGALPIPLWNAFVADLGFPDLKVAA